MIQFQDVYHSYNSGIYSLKGIDLRVDDGEFVFIVGPSGSGKSTLSKLITAELKPESGKVVVNGVNTSKMRARDIPHLRRTLGVVFQDFRLIERKTIYDNVAFAMRVVGKSPKEIKRRVSYVLDLVGLLHKARRKPTELSGGEQQRVSIARALVNNPSTIIADEPTGNLDPDRSLEIMTLLERINDLGTTVIVVTHEHELVDRFDKRVIAIDSGHIISDKQGGYFQYE